MSELKLSRGLAQALSEYSSMVFETWQLQNNLIKEIGYFERLGLPMSGRRLSAVSAGLYEMRISGELADRVRADVVSRCPEAGTGYGAEMLRQYARTLWAYHFPPEGVDADERWGGRLDQWQAAIDAACETNSQLENS